MHEIARIDWDALSGTEKRVLFDLHDRGDDGLLGKPHCENCACNTVEDLKPDERAALRSLEQRGYVYHDAMGILGEEDTWGVLEDYDADVREFRSDEGIYRERREAAERYANELAMTPTFPEFNLEEDQDHAR
ncbi:MAG: hypothetical protein AMXMBFR33_01650 [Candidatus Xenobia bacterium]